MKKEYKVDKHNSTVCGYPGRDFDWTKFPWSEATAKPIPKTTEYPERYHCCPNPWVWKIGFNF